MGCCQFCQESVWNAFCWKINAFIKSFILRCSEVGLRSKWIVKQSTFFLNEESLYNFQFISPHRRLVKSGKLIRALTPSNQIQDWLLVLLAGVPLAFRSLFFLASDDGTSPLLAVIKTKFYRLKFHTPIPSPSNDARMERDDQTIGVLHCVHCARSRLGCDALDLFLSLSIMAPFMSSLKETVLFPDE